MYWVSCDIFYPADAARTTIDLSGEHFSLSRADIKVYPALAKVLCVGSEKLGRLKLIGSKTAKL